MEGVIESLDHLDRSLDEVWAEEAEKRLEAYRAGHLMAISMNHGA
ncbi:MAG: addiction module protein [Gammaproteobacteria bacterium]|nr:addiction module protein [Gammaproteobacteria bacterium]MBT7830446.1 addiction module protein [Candidatus Neomarinimicrobiota bacterium]